MNSFIKRIFIILVLLIFVTAFSSSYVSLRIDNLAFVVALGIDVADNNNLKVSFEFTDIGSVSENGSTSESSSVINTVVSSSLDSAISMMNGFISKQLSLSHCKLIIFSEEFAQRGVSHEIYTLINNPQIRPSTNIVISKIDAESYIKYSEPALEHLESKYYEIFPSSSKYTGCTVNATIGDFFNGLVCETCEPFAILGGINDSSNSNSNASSNNAEAISNATTLTGKRLTENIGVAVFKDDKLVGELNAIETLSFLLLKNSVDSFEVSIPNPNTQEEENIDIYLYHDVDTKINLDITNGAPHAKIDINLTGKISSVSNNSDYDDNNQLSTISNSVNNYLESIISSYLYRTSREFNSDINNIGRHGRSQFLTLNDYENFDWLENYKNCTFEVNVDTNVKSGFLITET